ncbi:MAG: zinc carboxypeptidase, partial [Gelidibacter sp.]|nr:zinc carboxypeptidase [Gelidibacter sp.]
MKKITLLSVFLFTLHLSFSQELYKKVLISNVTPSLIKTLDQEGIDLSCGAVFKGNTLEIELEEHLLQDLKNAGINYMVLIDNMQEFYSKRATEDLPKATLEIQQMKSAAKSRKKSKSATLKDKSYSIKQVLVDNIGQYEECDEIDWEIPLNWNLNPNPAPNSFGGCLTYDMVLQELDDMRAQYPNLISAKVNASPTNQLTAEGRTVYMVRISDNPDIDEVNEPETLYQSLIHSREAATVMNQLYFMWYILENYATNPSIRNLVNNQELYFIPVFNPDGFVYNQTQAPNGGGGQRKNRNTTAGSCSTYLYGIDLNRNSEYYWGNGGSSTDPCDDTYMGTGAFSEKETQIMRDFCLQHNFKIALNHHSYKNAALHAYAGVVQPNSRADEYSKYNHDITFFNRFAHGPSTQISYINSGNMNDWMQGGPAGTSSNGTPTGTGSG